MTTQRRNIETTAARQTPQEPASHRNDARRGLLCAPAEHRISQSLSAESRSRIRWSGVQLPPGAPEQLPLNSQEQRRRETSVSGKGVVSSAAARFWAKVNKSDGCWLWTGSVTSMGYGQFAVKHNDNWSTHRYSWLLHHGRLPKRPLQVLHSCDVRRCVNPDHLWLGTQKDNLLDASRKGRLSKRFNRPHPAPAAGPQS